jgi:hypothetical protein
VVPELAVVVPSIGRARAIETVESIDASARAAGVTVEVVLAWQSSDAPPALPATARTLEVLPLGVSYAKNRALAGISAPFVAFVDDDELVDQEWARALISSFEGNPDVGAVFGAIAPLDDRGLAYCSFEGGVERRYSGAATPPWIVGGGGNMAVRREVLERLRGFDLLFGGGTIWRSAEDTDLVFRMLHAGETILWTPDAVVYHPTKNEEERLASRTPYGFGMGKLVRLHRDVGIGSRYAGYTAQSFLAGVRHRNRRRRREAAATIRAFAAGVGRRTRWVAPTELLALMPRELRGEVDVSAARPLPVQYRPKPHFVYLLDSERVLHVYADPPPELQTALADREVIRKESMVEGIPRVFSCREGRDSLWLIEQRRRSGRNADSAALRQVLEWATAMSKPLGEPLCETNGWEELLTLAERDAPAGFGRAIVEACTRLGALQAAHAHGDFQRKNVFVDDARTEVLDWEWARARDLPAADILFYALTAGGGPDQRVVQTLVAGGEPLDVPLRPLLAQLGVDDDGKLRDLLAVLFVRWAANERRWLAHWGARARPALYAELLEHCAPLVLGVGVPASLS